MDTNVKFVVSEVKQSEGINKIEEALKKFNETCKIYEHLVGNGYINEKRFDLVEFIKKLDSDIRKNLEDGVKNQSIKFQREVV